MPIYEYLCDDCGEHFEVMQKFADEPLTAHEKCGGKAHRLLSVPALQFKGSGFYITDYAKGSGSGSNNNNGGAKKGDSSSSSSSSETSSPSTPASTTSSNTKSDTKSDTKSSSNS